jgi:hypothetical protein
MEAHMVVRTGFSSRAGWPLASGFDSRSLPSVLLKRNERCGQERPNRCTAVKSISRGVAGLIPVVAH